MMVHHHAPTGIKIACLILGYPVRMLASDSKKPSLKSVEPYSRFCICLSRITEALLISKTLQLLQSLPLLIAQQTPDCTGKIQIVRLRHLRDRIAKPLVDASNSVFNRVFVQEHQLCSFCDVTVCFE